jgi:hypothetical protein
MPKFYIQSGSLRIIYNRKKVTRNPNSKIDHVMACCDMLGQLNAHDVLDEYFYVDERGYRDYVSADPETVVIPTEYILEEAGWK